MEIDVERFKHAVVLFASAVEEARRAFRPGRAGIVRIATSEGTTELPVKLLAAGLTAFAIASVVTSVRRGFEREREEVPLGIG